MYVEIIFKCIFLRWVEHVTTWCMLRKCGIYRGSNMNVFTSWSLFYHFWKSKISFWKWYFGHQVSKITKIHENKSLFHIVTVFFKINSFLTVTLRTGSTEPIDPILEFRGWSHDWVIKKTPKTPPKLCLISAKIGSDPTVASSILTDGNFFLVKMLWFFLTWTKYNLIRNWREQNEKKWVLLFYLLYQGSVLFYEMDLACPNWSWTQT